jgi:hypothetical protein
MNSIHFHLITNHFPIIVPVIALMVMFGGFLIRSEMIFFNLPTLPKCHRFCP